MRRFIAILFIFIFSFSTLGCDYQEYTDSRYSQAKKQILSQLNDPDSYKMEYIKYDKLHIGAKIKFRAKNGFGAMQINYAYAVFDKDGKLVRIDLFDKEMPMLEINY